MSDNGVRLSVKNAKDFDAWFRTTGAGSGDHDLDRGDMAEMVLRFAWAAREEVDTDSAQPMILVRTKSPEVKDLLLSYARMCGLSSDENAVPAHRAALAILSQIHVSRLVAA